MAANETRAGKSLCETPNIHTLLLGFIWVCVIALFSFSCFHSFCPQEKKERETKEFQKSKEQLEEEKRRAEIEEKAQEKYKEWMRKKKQEETERKLKEKVWSIENIIPNELYEGV